MRIIRTILLIALLFRPFYMMAQEDYEPFIVEGKIWYYEHIDTRNTYVYRVYFEGDTVVNGYLCKNLIEERPGFDIYSPCACREEGGMVWVYYSQYASQPWQEFLLYDFTCQEGDTVTNLLLYGTEKFLVDEVRNISSFGRDRRRIAIKQDGYGPKSYSGYWLEGVGSRLDMFNFWVVPHGGASERFLYCELDGERIADQSSFGDAALETLDIRETTSHNEDDDFRVFDLSGRCLRAIPRNGVYIRNEKKFVNK